MSGLGLRASHLFLLGLIIPSSPAVRPGAPGSRLTKLQKSGRGVKDALKCKITNMDTGSHLCCLLSGALSAVRPMVDSEVAQSCPTLCDPIFATPWTVANQAPPSMRFSRQEYWSGLPFPSPEYWSGLPFPSPRDTGLPFPSPRDLPDPRIEPGSPALWADALPSEPLRKSVG